MFHLKILILLGGMRLKGYEGERERPWPKTHWKFVAVYRERSRPVTFEKITPFYPRVSSGPFELLQYSAPHLGT
jgi:hypothetical protein